MKRLALLLVGVLVVTSCHSIDRGVFAQGPVPLDVLPLREPITYTVGTNAGQVVPAQHGLLASYFSGAAYMQPAHGEVLDHQQIDPNVDFQWNASGGVNPVIAVGGIDVSEGHPFRPPQWPIWSIVWEGFLDAPTTGEYLLNLHVNNGGWLEMKDAGGSLRTVISCPGGSGFEGDCPATVDLAAGRHYVRISYYNNAPSSANAIFSWQKPGDPALAVVPTGSLCTQDVAGCRQSQRVFLFVHGIRGNYRDLRSFELLFVPLAEGYRERPAPGIVRRFRYYQDVGDSDPQTGICRPREAVIPSDASGLPLNTRSISSATCDSQSNVGLNAVLLDEDVRTLARDFGGPVTIIANSMGGAIVRAFLAYSVAARTGAAAVVDHVYFLQAAHQGSWITHAKPLVLAALAPTGPVRSTIFHGVAEQVRKETGFDPARPAIDDLRPFFSETYRFVNPNGSHLPPHVGYFNVASDIRWTTEVSYVGYIFGVRQEVRFRTETGSFGDYVLLSGSDRPAALTLLGGARFEPALADRDGAQWVLDRAVGTRMEATIQHIPLSPLIEFDRSYGDPFAIPESHLNFGARMNEIRVRDLETGERVTLDRAILRQIARQDR